VSGTSDTKSRPRTSRFRSPQQPPSAKLQPIPQDFSNGSVPTALVTRFRGLRAVLTVCVLFWSLGSFGALGGDVSSVQADAAHLQGMLRVNPVASYTVHEIQAPDGTRVREYLSPAGKVFAVAWQGPWLPDLQQLLGSYFAQYQRAAHSPRERVSRVPVSVHDANLVVEQSGHMRSFVGRAYLVDQLPSGATPESIR
jgi:Protein of unknown function (DUF2844)